jgi:predicted negative regulator of RcsB-dependent stress response
MVDHRKSPEIRTSNRRGLAALGCHQRVSLRLPAGTVWPLKASVATALALVLVLVLAGCAKYNTYYNARKSFDAAERVREDAIRKNQDPPKPVGAQKTDYENAIAKAQKVLDDYPGHSLSDDALFVRAKSYYRLESYRMSIRQFDLLFTNFPATEYLEESLYLQALNYLLIGALDRSQDYLGQLERAFPDSRYQAEVSRVSGDNAYTMENWEAAATAYRQYLDLGDDAGDKERVALKLAECLWEQAAFSAADSTLAEMLAKVGPGDLKFRAELLRGRVLVRAGKLEQAGAILEGLDQPAAFYKAEGELTLVRAELLTASGNVDDAATLLQGMPTEWQTPEVKARAADLLAYRFLERQEYTEALEQFKAALSQKDKLDDPERTRRLNDHLRDYLAADTALADAKGERVPRLKLLQANAMLFGLDRPARAATLYREAAADTAVDSLLAARALYGLWIAYGQRLDNPDSAAIAAAQLQERYSESAQAREVRADGGGNLVEFLLAEREVVQQRNLANLSESERAALDKVITATESGVGETVTGRPLARRRMIYLARRDNLVIPPPDVIVPLGHRQDPAPAEERGDAAAGSGEPTVAPLAVGTTDTPDSTRQAVDPEAAKQPLEPEKPKKVRDSNWDRLREPHPGPHP